MLIFRYQILHTKSQHWGLKNTLRKVVPALQRYSEVVGQIKSLSRERTGLLDEKMAISVLNLIKQRELSKRIAKLTEDIEELRSEKALLIAQFEKNDDEGMKDVRKWVTSMEKSLQQLEKTQAKYQAELDATLTQFWELAGKGENMDKAELFRQRERLRDSNTKEAREKLRQTYEKQYSVFAMMEAEQNVENLIWEDEARLKPQEEKLLENRQAEMKRNRFERNRGG